MPELRKDPVVGRWVIIATERARRPGNIVDSGRLLFDSPKHDCPFCRIHETPCYIAKKNGAVTTAQDWDICVIQDKEYRRSRDDTFSRRKKGLYDVIEQVGTNEIVIETPRHILNMADLDVDQIRLVFETYVARINEMEKNPLIRYIMAYKSYRWSSGLHEGGHSRSHIIATTVRPLYVKEKLQGAKEYFHANQRCVYCDLIQQELHAGGRIILETDHFVALAPFAARFLFEVWILPKAHHCDFAHGLGTHAGDLAILLKTMLNKFKEGLNDPAYNFIIQTAPFQKERHAGKKWQTLCEDYHWHIELVPHLTRMAGFEKGTDFYICSIPPEDTAEYLRGVNI